MAIIRTEYKSLGAEITATLRRHTITVRYPYGYAVEPAHAAAAIALCWKIGLKGSLVAKKVDDAHYAFTVSKDSVYNIGTEPKLTMSAESSSFFCRERD